MRNFNNSYKLLVGALALVLVAGMTSPAFAGLPAIDDCEITLNQMVNTQIPANENVIIQKVIQCNGLINSIDDVTDCVLNDPNNFSNLIVNGNILTFDETIINGGDTSEEHCELEIAVFGQQGEVVSVFQELWINVPEDIPIGGTSFPVSTTTLLVAGFQANMGLWSLALVGIVGAAAAITVLQSKLTN